MSTELRGYSEIVLPSGRFARIKPPRWADIVRLYGSGTNSLEASAELIAKCCTVDGRGITALEVLDMDCTEVIPMWRGVNRFIELAFALSKGVA